MPHRDDTAPEQLIVRAKAGDRAALGRLLKMWAVEWSRTQIESLRETGKAQLTVHQAEAKKTIESKED